MLICCIALRVIFCSARTYESDMFNRASKKLGLDQAVLYGLQPDEKKDAESKRKEREELENLIKHGAWHAFKDFDETKSRQFSEADIDQILEKNTKLLKYESAIEAGSTFSRATFDSVGKGASRGPWLVAHGSTHSLMVMRFVRCLQRNARTNNSRKRCLIRDTGRKPSASSDSRAVLYPLLVPT